MCDIETHILLHSTLTAANIKFHGTKEI